MAIRDEDDDIYCVECGNEDPKLLAYGERYADSETWTCKVCGTEFSVSTKEDDE